MNVFTYGYMPWRRISNIPRNIKQFFRNIRLAWQRATRGFCDVDVWELYSFYEQLFRDTLKYLAENHCGCPVRDEDFTDELWTAWLNETSLLFAKSIEGNEYFPNKYEDEYQKILDTDLTLEKVDGGYRVVTTKRCDDFSKIFRKEEDIIYKKRKACRDEALDRLKEHWEELWD